MNPFVIAGALLLIGVLVGYVIITRREIATLCVRPLETKSSSQEPKKK